jgi:DNA-directed RNA polymerase specialized sigma subunit
MNSGIEQQKQEHKNENEEKKEYLLSYKKYRQQADRLEEQLKEVKIGSIFPKHMFSDMPKAKNKKDLSDYIVQCEELENRIIISRKRAIERFSEVQRQIELLEDENEKTVLTLRYLRNYNWEKICEWVMYSWKQVHRIHLKALQNFELKKET